VRTCTDPFYGGTYLCGGAYERGKEVFYFSNGTEEIFVIGTDHALWTRWSLPGGELSNWTSLGGRTYRTLEKLFPYSCKPDAITIAIVDHQHRRWARDRSPAGRWSDWHLQPTNNPWDC
jgi:hypothetical protein